MLHLVLKKKKKRLENLIIDFACMFVCLVEG